MPDLEPVSGDPFSVQLEPVSHDPFTSEQDAALASSMTHYPEQPNPAAPYLKFARDFASGGLQRALDLPNNPIGQALQSDAANTALGVMTPMKGAGALKGAAEAEAASPGIMAYHGSPHDFDKFDISKIGTGEGAQAYGHGLYFAENEGVAREYRSALTSAVNQALPKYDKAYAAAAKSFLESGYSPEQTIAGLRKSYKDAPTDQLEAAIREARGLDRGRMYQVSIKAEPHEFLDWDKPLSEQHPKVQDAIKKVAGKTAEHISPDMTGERALQWLQGDNWSTFAKKKYGYSSMLNKEQSANALRQAGIPGIRYLDEGSRPHPNQAHMEREIDLHQQILDDAKQSGDQRRINEAQAKLDKVKALAEPPKQTHNYVVFDDKLIDILKKYGLAGVIGAGGYHFKTQAVSHNPFDDTQ